MHSFGISVVITFFFLLVPTAVSQEKVKITILHTNDTHSQVEPLEKNNMGGYARRMGVIDQIRAEEKNVLLLDAGDYWQGTPYFNFFNGRIEIDAMNRMKYDAATLGNHEFDNGLDTMLTVLSGADFQIISSNYVFENAELKKLVKPYVILKVEGVKVGIMALGINPEGLVAQSNYQKTIYLDPVVAAKETSEFLKKKEDCDLIICLSHLGTNERLEITDFDIARATRHIDVIIGGHSHQIIEDTIAKNYDGRDVIIAQMGKSGVYLGRIDLELEKE